MTSRLEQSLGGESPARDEQARVGPIALPQMGIWTVEPFDISLGDVLPLSTLAVPMPRMCDVTLALTLALEIGNMLDQAVELQVFGAFANVPDDVNVHYDVGKAFNMEIGEWAGASISVSRASFPYIGVMVTPQSTPSSGRLTVRGRGQRYLLPALAR